VVRRTRPGHARAEPTQVEGGKARIEYRPLGPILAVMPWNFPIWQVLRGAVPALLAGNTYVLKHAPNVMGSAYCCVPSRRFRRRRVRSDQRHTEGVSSAIADPRIAAVTLTGSVRAGMAIGAQAGAALKKCVLELGGSDPFIVLNDADLDAAVQAAVIGRYQNSGQVCAAAKRLIIEEGVVEIHPQIRRSHASTESGRSAVRRHLHRPDGPFRPARRTHQQVRDTLEEGATLLLGGGKAEGPGNYYEPTVLADVTDRMTSFKQELFGPVASIITARDARPRRGPGQRQRLRPDRHDLHRPCNWPSN
jgi:succinate-semialdehyde dehydrogenase